MAYLHGYMVVALDGPLSEGFQHLSGSREVRLQLKGSQHPEGQEVEKFSGTEMVEKLRDPEILNRSFFEDDVLGSNSSLQGMELLLRRTRK